MSSKGAAGGLGPAPAPAGDNQKTLERQRSHFYTPATLRGSELRVQYFEKVAAFPYLLEESVWQFGSFNFKFRDLF